MKKQGNEIKLTTREYRALCEAARRFVCSHHGEPLDRAWTGLGTKTWYGRVVAAGLMEWVDGVPHRNALWLRLTPLGAKIVSHWLEHKQIVIKDYRITELPPLAVVL